MHRFFLWCATEPSCALHGSDPSGRWQRVLAGAEREPVPAPEVGASYGAQDLRTLGLAAARAGEQRWPSLAEDIRAAERGDASGFAPPGPKPYPAVPAPAVTECLDLPRPDDQAELESMVKALRDAAPNVGAASAIPRNLLLCVGWPTEVTNPPRPLPPGLPPLLAAGYWNEYATTSRAVGGVPGSGSIRHDGSGHVLYFSNECARTHIDRYFTDRVVPARGTRC